MTGLRTVPKFYIAAPFFNCPQLQLVSKIEDAFVDHNVPAFSPRSLDSSGIADDSEWQRRFNNNIDNLFDCDHVLAVADFEMPPKNNLYILGSPRTSGYLKDYASQGMGGPLNTATVEGRHIAGPLNLPDTGTVFEMGVQFGMWLTAVRAKIDFYERDRHTARRIVLFTQRPLTDMLNVMLTKSCHGVLHGFQELDQFLSSGDIAWHQAGPWKGRTR